VAKSVPAAKKEGSSKSKEFAPSKVRTIGELELSKSTEFRVVINSFDDRDKHYLDMRQWYSKKGEEEKLPGKGCSIEVTKIDDLIKLLKKAKARAIKVGLIEEG
jgi:hypothetical protein